MNEIRYNDERLADLLGMLPKVQRHALERELEQDPDLLAALQKIQPTEDSLLEWLRNVFPAARYQNAPHLRELLENLKKSAAELASGQGSSLRTASSVQPWPHETRVVHGGQDDTSRDLVNRPLKQLGRYRIESTIGQGGMGAVYLAHDEKLDRQVAIKIPFMGVQADHQVLERFKQEARSAASLHHRNICPTHDVGEIDGQPYLTMAFISGNTLTSWVDQRHSASEIIEVISKVARALHQAHQQGVIHRDLKPANIMIDDEGEPVVMDFGLARRDSGDDQPQLTQAGQIMGTPAYMPPEQIAGRNEEMGPACDIYGLGVILYELLAGKRPFNGDLLQLMSQIALESPPALRTINDQIDPGLETIVLKSLEKKSGDRWESMLAFAEALEAWEPKSLPNKKQPAKTRRWALIAVGLLGIIGLVWAAVILLKVDMAAGTIVLDINQSELVGAIVTIDGEEKITIKTGKGQETIGIRPDEMRHELKVKLAGFKTFSKEFTFETGNRQQINVELEPLKQKVATTSEFIWPKDQPAPAIAPFDTAQAKKNQEEWAKYIGVAVEKEVELPGGEKMVFMLIPPGEFIMGSSEEEQAKVVEEATSEKGKFNAAKIFKKESPQHRVRITKPFYLGKHLVTQAQWQSVMGDNPSKCRDSPSHPVENVSWNDVQLFLSKLEFGCALPTEAQWEYACRAGTITPRYFGDSRVTWPQHVWFSDNSGDKPHAVGELRPNPFGLHDMIGNLWEWCADWYGESYTTSDPINDPTGPTTGLNRVRRGSCFVDVSHGSNLRSAARVNNNPDSRNNFTGFRVAIAISTAK